MTNKHIAAQHDATFEGIRKVEDAGNEFWQARALSKVLDYSEYRHFLPVVERAREACKNSGQPLENHFEDILDMVEIGSGSV
jgi:DNA-damage-inducible protein D